MNPPRSRGYFGIGVEGVRKAGNVGALMRTAHAFGAGFVFLIDPAVDWRAIAATDTSRADQHLPIYEYPELAALTLPRGTALVGVEMTETAVDLPRFHHPLRAAYVLGPERGSLSSALLARCDHVVRIPTRFCLNVGLAGALVMYDRMITHAPFAGRR